MVPSERCYRLIKAWEGIMDGDPSTVPLEPYLCPADVVTTGWGHVLRDGAGRMLKGEEGLAVARAHPLWQISLDQAEQLLRWDAAAADKAVFAKVGRDVTQAQYDAMVSLAFNVGGGPKGFGGSTVLRLHRLGLRGPDPFPDARAEADHLEAVSRKQAIPSCAADAFPMWSYAKGRYVEGLYRRRLQERGVYLGEHGP